MTDNKTDLWSDTQAYEADLSEEIFKQLSRFNHGVEVKLNIRTTEFVGSISYGNDHEGYAKIWDVEKENPVYPDGYEIVFSDEAN